MAPPTTDIHGGGQPPATPPAGNGSALAGVVARLRPIVARGMPADATSAAVADELRGGVPSPELLSPAQRRGLPDRYQQHVLHVADDGSFSIVALVWRPGQDTPVHDHVSWCVVAVLAGVEHEIVYEPRADGRGLEPVARTVNTAGTVCGFAPPGDVHRVRNGGEEVAISLHIYGADIGELGTSIRRCYDVPVEGAWDTADSFDDIRDP